MREQRDTGDSLARLATALEALEFGPDASAWSADRDRLARTIRDYLIPRAVDPSTPMTAVIAGPTGSGKSTLLNSLAGSNVTSAGALRPTTQAPVVLTRPDIADRYESIGGVECEVVTAGLSILDSLTLVDTPDIDSTSTGHRATAEMLIDNSDVVVFVTSALRYADEVPWQVLRRAASRGAPVIHVLNRVGAPSAGAGLDFRSRLVEAGFEEDPVTVPEHHLPVGAGQVPSLAVRQLRDRLSGVIANRDEFAARVLGRVLKTTLAQVTELTQEITDFEDEIGDMATELGAHLADRVDALELEAYGRDLYPPPPADPSRWAARRWRRRARKVVSSGIEGLEREAVDHILSAVHSDLRHWLTDERIALRQRNVDPSGLTDEILGVSRSSLEGWVEFVERVAADHDEHDVRLGEVVLLDAALAEDDVPAVAILFGEEGPVLVDRARRELWGRLEAVYGRAGDLMIEAIRRRHGYLEDEELRASLGAVTSMFAPAYA